VTRALGDLVGKIQTLPVLPQVINHILTAVANPNSQITHISQLVTREPSLSASVLKLANSAYYGLPEKISDVNRAIVVIGVKTLRTLVVSTSMMSNFRSGTATGFNRANFWKHSIASGSIARELAQRCNANAELTYSAGLLHDIGKVIIDYYAPNDMEFILRKAQRDKLRFLEAEKNRELSHAELGAELVANWDLDPKLKNAILSHHDREITEDSLLFSAVTFADYLCHAKGLLAGNYHTPSLDAESWRELGLEKSDLPALLTVVNQEIALADAILCTASA